MILDSIIVQMMRMFILMMRIYDINPEIYEQLIQDSSMYDDEYEDEIAFEEENEWDDEE